MGTLNPRISRTILQSPKGWAKGYDLIAKAYLVILWALPSQVVPDVHGSVPAPGSGRPRGCFVLCYSYERLHA